MAVSANPQAAGVAPAHGLSRRAAAILAWTLWTTYVLLAAFSLLLESLGPSPTLYLSVLGDLAVLAYVTVGALIVMRHPENPIGWVFLAAALTLIGSLFLGNYAVYALVTWPGTLPGGPLAAWVAAWSRDIGFLLMFTFLFLLFPTGKLLSRRWRPLAWTTAAVIVLFTLIRALKPGPLPVEPKIPNPYGVPAAEGILAWGELILSFAALAAIAACVASVVVRYRRARGEERQQLKWFAYAATLGGLVVLAQAFPELLPVTIPDEASELVLIGSVALIAAAVGIAIFKYRLYDIDLIINRTLVYVPLTAILAGLYAVLDMVLGKLFLPLTTNGSDFSTVLTTLILAASFTPVKNGIQDQVDRRFKEVPAAIRTLQAFHEQVQLDFSVVDPREITRRLLAVAVGAFQAQSGAVYLRERGELQLIHAQGAWDSAPAGISVPLQSGDTRLGMLLLGPRPHDRAYTELDRATLEAVAATVAAAIERSRPASATVSQT